MRDITISRFASPHLAGTEAARNRRAAATAAALVLTAVPVAVTTDIAPAIYAPTPSRPTVEQVTPPRPHVPPAAVSVSSVSQPRAAATGVSAAAVAAPATGPAVAAAFDIVQRSGVSALALPGTSPVVDRGLTDHTREVPAFASFGHQPVRGQWFDKSGNWADSGTAVSSDQLSAMPARQINQLADATGKGVSEMRFGDAWKATRFPAVGEALPGERVDAARGYDLRSVRPSLNFGHAPVNGRLFDGSKWADSKTLVSADQAAAMRPAQRAELARSAGVAASTLRLGSWQRVLITVDARALNGFLERSASTHGVPPTLLKAVAWKESTWNPKALSFDGQHGKGLMQIDDRYHDFASTPAAFDPVASADYGARYLSDLRRQHGSWDAALAAYNGSWSYVTRVRAIEAQRPWQSALVQTVATRAGA